MKCLGKNVIDFPKKEDFVGKKTQTLFTMKCFRETPTIVGFFSKPIWLHITLQEEVQGQLFLNFSLY